MYLDLNLLYRIKDDNFSYTTSILQECLSIEKGYSIIEHAYDTINNDNDLYLADAISNLRKAVNYRITDIFNNLGISNLKMPLGKYKKLEKLEILGIVKPLLINKLLTIRNGIEYEGANPPNKEVCKELIDVVWYFYRSTDIYCTRTPDIWELEWEEDGKECFLSIEFDLLEHKILEVRGRCPEKYFSDTKNSPTFIPLKTVDKKIFVEDESTKENNYHQLYFKTEIEVSEIPEYLDFFSFSLKKW